MKPEEGETMSVFIAMPVASSMAYETQVSLLATQQAARGVTLGVTHGISSVVLARILCAKQYLDSACAVCAWIDADIQWQPSDLFRITSLASKLGVVGATYPDRRDGGEFVIGGIG